MLFSKATTQGIKIHDLSLKFFLFFSRIFINNKSIDHYYKLSIRGFKLDKTASLKVEKTTDSDRNFHNSTSDSAPIQNYNHL